MAIYPIDLEWCEDASLRALTNLSNHDDYREWAENQLALIRRGELTALDAMKIWFADEHVRLQILTFGVSKRHFEEQTGGTVQEHQDLYNLWLGLGKMYYDEVSERGQLALSISETLVWERSDGLAARRQGRVWKSQLRDWDTYGYKKN